MPFPTETLDWATSMSDKLTPLLQTEGKDGLEDILRELLPDDDKKKFVRVLKSLTEGTDHPTPKKLVAATLFYGLRIKYGFEESLEIGIWSPWPNESKSVNCYGQAIANYMVASQCGLDPIFVEFIGLKEDVCSQRAPHGVVVVNVGSEENPEHWVIDQPLGMYGPVSIADRVMVVENIAAKKPRTYRKDYRIKTFDFIQNIAQVEETIVSHIEQLRLRPETVLYSGQRLGIPQIDAWQSEEALEAVWYLKFTPDRTGTKKGDIVSRVLMDRPAIKSRGLEYKIVIGHDGAIEKETITGLYCTGMVWTEFVNEPGKPVPVVHLDVETVLPILEGLTDIPVQERAAFEKKLMNESQSTDDERVKAARISFDALHEMGYGPIVSAFSVVEALYQHEIGEKDTYLTSSQRVHAIKKLKARHGLFAYYAKAAKVLKQTSQVRSRLAKRAKKERLLTPDRQESPRTQRYLDLGTEEQRFRHIVDHRPTYIDDAVDRMIFYGRKIKGKETNIHAIAKSTFGNDYDNAVFCGYVRIFTEFLGHMAVCKEQLFLEKHKEKVIEKIT